MKGLLLELFKSGFGYQPGLLLVHLIDFSNLHVERSKLATVPHLKFVSSDAHKRACALAPTGHHHRYTFIPIL